MTLPTQTNAQTLAAMITGFAGNTGQLPVFTPGDALLAFFETINTQIDFLQGLIQVVNNLTRAQTSSGSDLDTFYGQFGFSRLPATFAEGPVTFSTINPAPNPVNIPAATLAAGAYVGGAQIQTQDGSIVYQVIPDTTQSAYNATLNAYVLAKNATSVVVSAQALTAGSSGNVTPNQLNTIGSSLPGIYFVTNGAAINNGINAEADDSYASRFVLWFGSLAEATQAAIQSAAEDVQQGLQITLSENKQANGTTQYGAFTVFVDNGTGSPPGGLLTQVYNAVYAVRAFTIQPYTSGPTVITATIGITIRVAAGYVTGTVETAVKAAIVTYVGTLMFGQTLFVSSVESAALAVAGVVAVQPGTTINSAAADLTCTIGQEIRATTGSVSVGSY